MKALSLDDTQKQAGCSRFVVKQLLKLSSRTGRHLHPLELTSYSENRRLCIVHALDVYIVKTSSVEHRSNYYAATQSHMVAHQGIPFLDGSKQL